MRYTSFVSVLVFFLFAAGLMSCKKKDNSSPLGASAIVRINLANSNGEITYYRMVYDVNNNVDSIIYVGGGVDTGSNGFLKFSYVSSSYTIADKNNNYTYVDLNANFQVDTIRSSTNSEVTYMKYYGTQIGSVNTRVPITTYPYYAIYTTDYVYANGDIMNVTLTSGSDAYDYDAGHSGQLGDPQRISQFLQYGRAFTTSAHLATDLTYGSDWLEKYSYTFDGNGRISVMTRVLNNVSSGGVNDTLRYSYFYNF